MAPATDRRLLLRYAIGVALVMVAAGIGLLLPPHAGVLVALFTVASGVASWRGGWKVGLTTTALSILAMAVAFEGIVTTAHLMMLALTGIAASVVLGRRATRRSVGRTTAELQAEASLAAEIRAEIEQMRVQMDDELASDRASARSSLVIPSSGESLAATAPDEERRSVAAASGRRQRMVWFAMYAGLPILVLVVYTNISDLLIRSFSVPSILQPLILLLAIPLVLYRDAFRPEAAVLRPVTIALMGYSLLLLASSNWARNVALADNAVVDLVKGLGILIVVACLAASWRALRGALIALAGGAALLAVLTLVQVVVGDPALEFGGLAAIERGHLFGDLEHLRPSGPVGDPNYFARILLLAFPAAAFLGVGSRSVMKRAAYIAAAAAIGLAILFTYSRGGILALAAVAVLLVVVRRLRLTPVNAIIAVAVLGALASTTVGQRMSTMQALLNRGVETGGLDNSLDKRWLLLEAGWQMFADHPVVGVGAGNFASHYVRYSNMIGWSGLDYTPRGVGQYPHNLYLEVAVETGLLGLLLFGLVMAMALVGLHRSRQKLLVRGESAHAALVTAVAIAIAGYLISSLFLHSGFQRFLWLVLGLAVAAIRLTEEGGLDESDVSPVNTF